MNPKKGTPLWEALVKQGHIDPDKSTGKRRHGNIPTYDSQGRLHPSKKQARITDEYRLTHLAVIPEVSMPLSHRNGDRIRVDMLVVHKILDDGTFIGEFVDPKGHLTDTWKQKMRRFEDAYGLTITLV